MAEFHVPGAVFSMVKDSEIYFKKGYGYADLENDIPADPDYTLFRIGSVTKLVTATAVMQLYEQGLLDLEEDLNQKLSIFELEEKFSRPVTAAHLLTHTGGFDERLLGTSVRNKEEIVPLGQTYRRHSCHAQYHFCGRHSSSNLNQSLRTTLRPSRQLPGFTGAAAHNCCIEHYPCIFYS